MIVNKSHSFTEQRDAETMTSKLAGPGVTLFLFLYTMLCAVGFLSREPISTAVSEFCPFFEGLTQTQMKLKVISLQILLQVGKIV